MVSTKVVLAGIELDNPIIPASGTFGFGREFAELYDISKLGSISFKGTTKEARIGNAQPRIADCASGMLNAVGLQNPGADAVAAEELPELVKAFPKPLVANISGFSEEEFCYCAKVMDAQPSVGIIEVNVSCPNVHAGGVNFASDRKETEKITKAVKAVTTKPVFVKLSPNVTDIADMAKGCEEAGADGISLINTLLGMRIDIKRRKPVLANRYGGYSGPGIFPVALRMVDQVRRSVDLPIMGMGGIETVDDVIEMIMAGATAVQVGAAILVDPWACEKLVDGLPKRMEELGIETLDEIRGIA